MGSSPTSPVLDSKIRKRNHKSSPVIPHQNRTNEKRLAALDAKNVLSDVIVDRKHNRVWKACERCRQKKTKCDGCSPCKRCSDDNFNCIAGIRRKTEFKQTPKGYAEVLENTNHALTTTVLKLYEMVIHNQSWTFEPPGVNAKGQPIIHNIAKSLGAIRACPDMESVFPVGTEDMAVLEERLRKAEAEDDSDSNICTGRDMRAGSDESHFTDESRFNAESLSPLTHHNHNHTHSPPPMHREMVPQPLSEDLSSIPRSMPPLPLQIHTGSASPSEITFANNHVASYLPNFDMDQKFAYDNYREISPIPSSTSSFSNSGSPPFSSTPLVNGSHDAFLSGPTMLRQGSRIVNGQVVNSWAMGGMSDAPGLFEGYGMNDGGNDAGDRILFPYYDEGMAGGFSEGEGFLGDGLGMQH